MKRRTLGVHQEQDTMQKRSDNVVRWAGLSTSGDVARTSSKDGAGSWQLKINNSCAGPRSLCVMEVQSIRNMRFRMLGCQKESENQESGVLAACYVQS